MSSEKISYVGHERELNADNAQRLAEAEKPDMNKITGKTSEIDKLVEEANSNPLDVDTFGETTPKDFVERYTAFANEASRTEAIKMVQEDEKQIDVLRKELVAKRTE